MRRHGNGEKSYDESGDSKECKIIRDLCPDADAFPQSCRRCYVFEMYQKIRKEEDDNGK